jgi:hypothetical protein
MARSTVVWISERGRRIALGIGVVSVLAMTGVVVAHYVKGPPAAHTNFVVAPAGTATPLPTGVGSPPASASASAAPSASKGAPGKSRGPATDQGRPVAGFPDAGSTGVPAGVMLKQMTGELVVREAGTVIDGVNLVGKISVEADNVTIRRTRVTAPKSLPNSGRDEFTVVQQATKAHNLTLQDCEVDGSGLVYRAVNATNGIRINRCELRNVGHGVEVGDNYTVENSWIHSTTDGPDHDWHVDGIISSIGVNGVIRHNTIVLTGGSLTGAVSVGSSLGRIDNVLIQDNLLAGGNYCVYVQDQGYPATRIRVLDNHFSTMAMPKVGVYGIWYGSQLPKDVVRSGNRIHETGAPADEEPDWG